jgi:sortase A
MRFTIRADTLFITAVFSLAIFFLADGFYLKAKAKYAQYLIGDAWQHYAETGEPKKPWPWADTFPIGELTMQNESHYILAGASGRNLAFGPSHLDNTANLGSNGNAAIAGHRDTHFEQLKSANIGDLVYLSSRQENEVVKQVYQVKNIKIVEQDNISVLEETNESTITLITCYPFDSVEPNPSQRYIVKAVRI